MSVTFRLTPHGLHPEVMVCEIWVGDKFVAALYPEEPNAVKLVTSHLEGDEGELHLIRFEP
jgi:hypothetical protein